MGKLTQIDTSSWDRREIYDYFKGTTMYTTVQLDITNFLTSIKKKGVRFYPAVIYCIAKVINQNEEFKYGLDENGNLCVWDKIEPMYTLPRKDNPGLFSMAVTKYTNNFTEFYNAFVNDYKEAEVCGRLLYNVNDIKNVLGVTAMSDLHFTSFAFGSEVKPDFTPFTVIGKYEKQRNKITLPICGEFAHSVNDGYHINFFFKEIEKEFNQLINYI